MKIDSAAAPDKPTAAPKTETEDLDKDDLANEDPEAPEKAGAKTAADEALKKAMHEVEEEASSKKSDSGNNSANSEVKKEPGKLKKILIWLGVAVVAILGLKFVLGKKKS